MSSQDGGSEVNSTERENHDSRQGSDIYIVKRSWIALSVATLFFALLFILLSVPGVLMRPGSGISDDEILAAQQDVNRSLEQRIEELRQAETAAMCLSDGQLYGRADDGLTLELLNPVPGLQLAPLRSMSPPDEAISGSETAALPQSTGAAFVDLMDSAIALVMTPGSGPNGDLSMGTGFFIAPGLLITNRHVAEASSGGILIANPALDAPAVGTIQAMTASSDFGHPDFALIAAPAASHLPHLSIGVNADRVQPVIAAGYPGVVTATDERFHRLLEGDASAAPEVSFTDGVVTSLQAGLSASLILHSAPISPGNSGGPLVDLCGRAIGINTFVRSEDSFHRVNYAIGHETMREFLVNNGASPTIDTSICTAGVPTVSSRSD